MYDYFKNLIDLYFALQNGRNQSHEKYCVTDLKLQLQLLKIIGNLVNSLSKRALTQTV